MTPLSALGLLCVLVARKYTLKRNVVKAGEQPPSSSGSQSGEAAMDDQTKPTTRTSEGDETNETEKVKESSLDKLTMEEKAKV
jgi:hypothetical protein